MSVPPNIDLFNRFTLAIFQKLYLSFPNPIELEIVTLLESVTPDDATYDQAFNQAAAAGDTIEFLAAEGFLIHQGPMLDASQYNQVRLTMKGLAILGMPGALTRKESLISEILTISAKGLKDAAKDQVQELASRAFAFAIASAPAIVSAILPQ